MPADRLLMFSRHVLHENRHAAASLVDSEVTVVSAACPYDPFLLVSFQGTSAHPRTLAVKVLEAPCLVLSVLLQLA